MPVTSPINIPPGSERPRGSPVRGWDRRALVHGPVRRARASDADTRPLSRRLHPRHRGL